MAELIYEDVIPGGAHWSLEVPRGVSLSFVDESGGANVGMLMYNPRNPLERYNAPDTLGRNVPTSRRATSGRRAASTVSWWSWPSTAWGARIWPPT
ncbi:MAG: DUF1989 domain-containing protein [Acidihalobacter sp.]